MMNHWWTIIIWCKWMQAITINYNNSYKSIHRIQLLTLMDGNLVLIAGTTLNKDTLKLWRESSEMTEWSKVVSCQIQRVLNLKRIGCPSRASHLPKWSIWLLKRSWLLVSGNLKQRHMIRKVWKNIGLNSLAHKAARIHHQVRNLKRWTINRSRDKNGRSRR